MNTHGMPYERWDELMDACTNDEDIQLTEDEIKAGWHFCDDWDGLLVHPDDIEFQHCTCHYMKEFRTKERVKAYEEHVERSKKAMDSLAELDEMLDLLNIPRKNSGNT